MSVVKIAGAVTVEQAEFVREMLDQIVQHDQDLSDDERLSVAEVANIIFRSIKEGK